MFKFFWYVPVFLLLVSCTSPTFQDATTEFLAYIPRDKGTLLADFAPGYLIENPERVYNRIGTPSAYQDKEGQHVIIDPARPAVYVEERKFTTEKDAYTNLIYRVHFQETPDDLIPFRLGAGKNVGNLFIITLNSLHQPVLYTTVQTCGCYLAFVPTSHLAKDSFPECWPNEMQTVYGETLPAFISLENFDPQRDQVIITLRNATHRTVDLFRVRRNEIHQYRTLPADLSPVENLEQLPVEGGGTISFFEQSGPQKGFVRNNSKIWERLLMSWWTFDWRIGEDKKFGKMDEDSPVFFTSLKPWARDDSDMRDFKEFLSYWGWDL